MDITQGIIIEGKKEISIKKLQREALGNEDVRININRISLCGSDKKIYSGTYNAPVKYPIIPGHEWSGEVLEVGESVKSFKPGDHVTGDCSKFCGRCQNCFKDKNLCSYIEKFGITIPGYARNEAVTNQKYLYKADENVSFKALALAEPFSVAYHALVKCEETKGASFYSEETRNKKMLIIGCGAIGAAAYILARFHFGYENVHVYDTDTYRIKKLAFAAGENILAYEPGEHSLFHYNMYNRRGFDIVCDFAGVSESFNMALRECAPCQTVVTCGIFVRDMFDAGLITLKSLRVIGSMGGTGEFESVLEFFKLHGDKAERMVEKEYGLEEAAEAFENQYKVQIIF